MGRHSADRKNRGLVRSVRGPAFAVLSPVLHDEEWFDKDNHFEVVDGEMIRATSPADTKRGPGEEAAAAVLEVGGSARNKQRRRRSVSDHDDEWNKDRLAVGPTRDSPSSRKRQVS